MARAAAGLQRCRKLEPRALTLSGPVLKLSSERRKAAKVKQQTNAAKVRLRGPRSNHNYAQERGPRHQPPIRTMDASVAPPEVTSYPEYSHLEFSSPPAFDIHSQWTVLKVALKLKKETALNATKSRGFARLVWAFLIPANRSQRNFDNK